MVSPAFLPKTLDELRLHDPSGACVRYTTAGVPYEELSCLYPSIGWTYFGFEKDFDAIPAHNWVKSNKWFPVFGVTLYMVMIFAGQKYFDNRKPLNWRKALIAWNLVLAVFSTAGFLRTLPALVHSCIWLHPMEWLCSTSENSVLSGSTGLWVQLWILSKFPEFLDTLFLVVHKKKIIFLHAFHHILTFAGSFWGFQQSPPPISILGVAMNYGVHAVMYLYYMLMAMGCKPKWLNPFWITAAQLGQMVVGMIAGAVAISIYNYIPDECVDVKDMIKIAAFGYAAFGLLFGKLFLQRYFVVKSKHEKTA